MTNRLNGVPHNAAPPTSPTQAVADLQPGRLLNIYELTRFFGVSKRTVWRWVKEGTLPPPIVVTRRIRRWAVNDLLPMLQKRAPIGGQDQ